MTTASNPNLRAHPRYERKNMMSGIRSVEMKLRVDVTPHALWNVSFVEGHSSDAIQVGFEPLRE